ncbi:MAG: sugar transferase, partial [Alphaproteobacteria bacterium]|nr:sugar transferase [Alphaproteobacteria bacterium]
MLVRLARRSLVPFDLAILIASFGGAYALRVDPERLGWSLVPAMALSGGLIIVATHVIGGLRLRRDMAHAAYITDHLAAMLAAFLLSVAGSALLTFGELGVVQSRGAVLAAFLTHSLLSASVRSGLARSAERLARDHFLGLIGPSSAFSEKGFLLEPFRGELECRLLELDGDGGRVAEARRTLDGLDERCQGIVLLDAEAEGCVDLAAHLLNNARRIPVYSMEDYFAEHLDREWLGGLGPRWLVSNGFPVRRRTATLNAKRILDLVVAVALGIPFLILLPPLAAAIRLDSPGPVFYRQRRIGLAERPFTIIKLRSMETGAEAGGHSTRPGDPRVTRFVRWLRAVRLDEFPQLWNVLVGDMSVVGPRAESAELVARYAEAIPHYHFRHLVRPGVTGLA